MASPALFDKLRAWRTAVPADLRALVRRSLEDTCAVFGSKTGVMAIEESEEPWILVATLRGSQFTWLEENAADFDPLVAAELGTGIFFASDTAFTLPGEKTIEVSGGVHERIVAEVGSCFLSIPVGGDPFSGRLFVARDTPPSGEDWLLGETVGRLVSAGLDGVAAVRAAVLDALSEERVRVGRDLHDGILQSFTGVVLQLETIHSLVDEQPSEAKRLITQAQALVMSDQRELRTFVETLRPRARRELPFDLGTSLQEMSRRFDEQWGVTVRVNMDGVDPVVGASLGHETYRLIQEAVTNSARHGAATTTDVHVRTGQGKMSIEVTDNGKGFPFHGTMSLAQLRSGGHGPSTLAERVASLNGDLTVSSDDSGARVEISIPLGFEGG